MKYFLTGALALALTPFAYAGEISVSYSEDFAQELEETLGEREGEYLTELVTRKLTDVLGPELAGLGDVNIVIEDAKPNRPTMKQMTDDHLDMSSFSLGGAKLTGTILDNDGNVLVSLTDKYYGHDIRWAQNASKWSDARRGIGRFVTKLDQAVDTASAEGPVS